MRPLDEQTVLITGATDGLGRALARDLAGRGMTVLVHGRDRARGQAVVDELGSRARLYLADLASLAQVRAMAAAIKADVDRLDVLVSNAGIGREVPGGPARQESADGVELRFAVNYLAGYLLTRELLPLLRAAGSARIVNVSSAAQMLLDLDDVHLTRGYSGTRAYSQSKLAQILSTVDLAEELEGTGITVNALHPATFMPTKIVATPTSTIEEGVEATARLVVDPALEGVTGRYFDGLRETRAHEQAYDPAARAALRRLSDELVG
ncbi:NAD(P)-dependent dehydrogenase (short-subunit alcohol dehydrogenase family) [Geodermatophilus bullaregiensis]|uniref:SDR family NAD(P)-dependent oxidoreductase n=1 Tax=Geodermatophilus bullaregiensis TaxID=1564160 RepID=UPI00195F162F|nr:SDR family NAD(P)-dependent oxidoreductase [Geodermatophilus bullaregiensis]MBM7808278.1 NAD(P)-dependent dehydrogenase (short-subunit alcohol dehydrogenase family) [Geodermatophilus bullaregiensis]